MTRLGAEQARRAGLPLGRMRAVAGMQLVLAAPGVGVDEQQPLVLAGERAQDFEQQHVFVDVGEIAGVILMAVLHETPAPRAARLYTVRQGADHVEVPEILILAGVLAASACAAERQHRRRAASLPRSAFRMSRR